MKKQYTQPAIDLFELEVEQGIAQSEITIPGGGFNLGDEANYGDDVMVSW